MIILFCCDTVLLLGIYVCKILAEIAIITYVETEDSKKKQYFFKFSFLSEFSLATILQQMHMPRGTIIIICKLHKLSHRMQLLNNLFLIQHEHLFPEVPAQKLIRMFPQIRLFP